MDKIEINEENYEQYQEFLDAKSGAAIENHSIFWSVGIGLSCFMIFFAGMTGVALIIKPIYDSLVASGASVAIRKGIALSGLVTGGLGFTIFSIYKFVTSGIPQIFIKIFQKKYPDFDIHIDETEVKKELEKYIQLSKIPEDIEKKKLDHLSNYQDIFCQLTTEERLEFLKKEKEFWEQVAIQEKYQDVGGDTTGQVGIGQVNVSTENQEKVYHI